MGSRGHRRFHRAARQRQREEAGTRLRADLRHEM